MTATGWVLDVTRLVLRVGRPVLTGIDRVERAWLRRLAQRDNPFHLLLQGRGGPWLLPGDAAARLDQWLDTPPVPQGWREAVTARRGPRDRRAARLAALRLRAGAMRLGADALAGAWYLNLGHAFADPALLAGLRDAGMKVAVMVHDTIPLDFPQFSRPHAVAEMRRLLATAAGSDLILANSRATADDIARHVPGPLPPLAVSHLGVVPAPPDPALLPPGPDWDRPLFLSLGTIEPRKDHALLIDLWDGLIATPPEGGVPQLVIAGREGWMVADLMRRIAAHPAQGRLIHHLPALPDAAVSAALLRARALLMPSHAEGFGLPVAEAAVLGVPSLVRPLPVYAEVLGDNPVYAPVHDLYHWQKGIVGHLGPNGRRYVPPVLPGWDEHVDRALTAMC